MPGFCLGVRLHGFVSILPMHAWKTALKALNYYNSAKHCQSVHVPTAHSLSRSLFRSCSSLLFIFGFYIFWQEHIYLLETCWLWLEIIFIKGSHTIFLFICRLRTLLSIPHMHQISSNIYKMKFNRFTIESHCWAHLDRLHRKQRKNIVNFFVTFHCARFTLLLIVRNP